MPSKVPEDRRHRSSKEPDGDDSKPKGGRNQAPTPRSSRKTSSSSTPRDSRLAKKPQSDLPHRKDRKHSRELDSRHIPRSRTRSPPSETTSSPCLSSVVPELGRRGGSEASSGQARQTAYPGFSKEHSREIVIVNTTPSDQLNGSCAVFTPDQTDLSKNQFDRRPPESAHPPRAAPPSPPLTTEGSLRKRSSSLTKSSQARGSDNSRPKKNQYATSTPSSSTAVKPPKRDGFSPGPDGAANSQLPTSRQTLDPSLYSNHLPASNSGLSSGRYSKSCHSSASNEGHSSPASRFRPNDSSPRLNAKTHSGVPSSPDHTAPNQTKPNTNTTQATSESNLSQSSPPYADYKNQQFPRVDYLLLNGGLNHPISNRFIAAGPLSGQAAPHPGPTSPVACANELFAPYQQLLDHYDQVMRLNGSMAVACGQKSVARRLLDRLEVIFSRNISFEYCDCIICGSHVDRQMNENMGMSWGDILELVSGRQQLPRWPPFLISACSPLQSKDFTASAPMQKLDIDVPEEYRDHFIRQSLKTRQAVRNWLEKQPDTPTSPPREIDDDTLAFAIITHLDPGKRQLFHTLLHDFSSGYGHNDGESSVLDLPRPELLERVNLAIQRLYRLPIPPRYAECAIYMIENPDIHDVLVTLSAISEHEWEILVSGRFDGFVWSGAGLPERPGSDPVNQRLTSVAAPVSLDEEAEIATITEIECQVYAGMEALEDAFEKLHLHAEATRFKLRERAEGLIALNRLRRQAKQPRNPTDSPNGMDGNTDDGLGGLRAKEIFPEDSASNVSFRRRRAGGAERKSGRIPIGDGKRSPFEEVNPNSAEHNHSKTRPDQDSTPGGTRKTSMRRKIAEIARGV